MGYSRKLFLFGLTCRLSLTGIGNSRDVCTFEYVEEYVCSICEKLPPLLAYREATNREEIRLITDF